MTMCTLTTWPINGKTSPYGRNNIGGKRWYHHRYVWTQAHGPIPPGMFVCHKCDNPPCVNLEHLFLGTRQDNIDDCVAKGRATGGGARGERNGKPRTLSVEQVYECRLLWSTGVSGRELAERYGLSVPTISEVVNKRTYRFVA